MATTIAASKEALAEAQSLLWNQSFSYLTSMALGCAVRLGLPELISNHERPVTISEIVTQLSIPQAKSDHLYRLMRLLVHNGVFALHKDQDGREGYQLTTLSMLLTKKHSIDLSPWGRGVFEPAMVSPFFITAEWFHSSSSNMFEAAHGLSFYDYATKHPEFNNRFNAAMACDSKWLITEIIDDLKPMFEGSKSLVDVGGNQGTVTKAISEAVPHLKCSVYDLPHVIAGVKEMGSVKPIAGNMFEFIPSADVVMLKTVLGDWGDKECLTILKRCKEAITREASGGKLIIIGLVVDDKKVDTEPTLTELFADLAIIMCLNTHERTEIELKELLCEAGFTNYKITPTSNVNSRTLVNSIIEAFV